MVSNIHIINHFSREPVRPSLETLNIAAVTGIVLIRVAGGKIHREDSLLLKE